MIDPDWFNEVEFPLFAQNKEEEIILWNDAIADITGVTSDEALGQPLEDFFSCEANGKDNHVASSTTGNNCSHKSETLGESLSRSRETTSTILTSKQNSKSVQLRVMVSTRRNRSGQPVGTFCLGEEVVVNNHKKQKRSTSALAIKNGHSTPPATRGYDLDNIGTPMFILDRDGRVLSCNPKAKETFQNKNDTDERNHLSSTRDFIAPGHDAEKVERRIHAIFEGGEAAEKDVALRVQCCNSCYFQMSIAPYYNSDDDADGRIVEAVVLVAMEDDVTTTTLEATDRPQQALLDSADVPMFGFDLDGVCTEWNKPAENMFSLVGGDNKDLCRGEMRYLDAIISPSQREEFTKIFTKVLAGGGLEQATFDELELLPRKSSDEEEGEHARILFVTVTKRKDSAGTTVGYVAVAQDITDSARHNRAVASMAEELRRLVDTANAPIFGIDIDGDVNEWNDKTAEITGFTKEEAFDKPLVETFIVPSLQQSVQEVLDKALEGEEETSNYELEFVTKYGEIRYLLVNATTRRDADNRIVGVVGVAQDVTEAAQHDRAVASMARELRQLVDTANAPIFGIDVHGNVNEWNDKTAEITGFSGDEAFNQPLIETFIVPKLRLSVQEVLDNALKGRGTSNYELEFRTKSNEIRYLLVNATTRRDAENNIVGVVGVAQDVTEAAKHDRAVAAMANELRHLIDTANAPIFGIDVDGDVNEWNDKTAEITGFTKEEAFDCPLVETFIVPSLRHSVQEVMDDAIRGRGTSNYELEFRTKSNEIRHLLVNATTRRDADNNVVGVVGVAQDVTEAVYRDRAVAAMANELRQLIDTANAPIFGVDCDGNINEWNDKTAEITGYTKDEAFDVPLVAHFIAPSMRQQVHEVLEKAFQGFETSNYELEMVSKSGQTRYLLVNATTRRDPENKVVGVVGVAQDVTEDRRHSRELAEMLHLKAAQEAKVETERNMTAYFAHELRNPLGAIDSALNAMPDDLPESAKSLVAGMQLCTGFMSSIMNNLLDVRKMEEGKMTLNAVPISLQAVLISVHKMLLPSVRSGVSFLQSCDVKANDWVMGDAHRIQQVMTNVVTNAIKYTVSGSIKLSITWEGKFVRFECADTGPGIPKGEQKKLFERFVQRGGAPGTGLGLAIAKHLVDLTGGSIRFESDPSLRPGTNCIVMMPLPVCGRPEVVINQDDTTTIEDSLAVLIIDDVKMNRTMLKRRIKKGIAPNADIVEASTGEEALEICGNCTFDVIVVDQYMEEAGGVMVGTDVVFAMRRMRIESIIIGCSGNDMDEQFYEAGSDYVWKKPMPSNARIIADIRTAMAKRRHMVLAR